MCEKIVVYENFSPGEYFSKLSQVKIGNIYLIARKKRGRIIGEEKKEFKKRIFEIVSSIFDSYC